MPNLMGGLEALANAGTGFIQGRNQAQNQQYQQQIQQLALHNQQQASMQNDMKIKNQQSMSDDAMALSAGIIKPSTMPGQTSSSPEDTQPTPQMSMADKFSKLSEGALARGDLDGASQAYTLSVNANNDLITQQEHQAATQLTDLKAKQLETQQVGQSAMGVTDQSSYSAWRLAGMSDSNNSPGLQQMFKGLPEQYNPAVVSHIANGAFTAEQKVKLDMEHLKTESYINRQSVQSQNETARTRLDAQRTGAYVAHQERLTKVGGDEGAKVGTPTLADLKVAAPIVANTLYPDDPDALDNQSVLQGPGMHFDKNNNPVRDFSAPIISTIVSRTKQAVANNRSLNYNQELIHQTQLAKENGELQSNTVAGKPGTTVLGHTFGGTPDTTTESFNPGGKGSKDKPIPITAGMHVKDMKKGAWYSKNGKVEQWTGQP